MITHHILITQFIRLTFNLKHCRSLIELEIELFDKRHEPKN